MTPAPTLTAPPAPGTAAAPPARRRRRWRGWVGALAVVAVAVPAGAATAGGRLMSDAPAVAADGAATHLPEFGPRGSLVFVYEDGATITYAVPIRNDGPLPVTVTGLDLPADDERPLLVPVTARTLPSMPVPASFDAAVDGPSTPLRLAPGASGAVVVRARFDHCEYHTERALQLVDHHTLRVRVLGVPATRRLPLADDLVVRSPTIRRCPDRVMDRAAHQR